MAEISVIVPVYNVEKYLKQCLDSIVNQTFKDIEIICVNDGSTDSSRTILEEYAKKDSRIKIIDKENGGLSSARNAGIKKAKGNFISFIDSDDWVDITMFEKLYKNITELNTDISICAVNLYDEEKQEINSKDKYFNLGFFDKTFDNRAFSYLDTKPFIMDVCVMAWNKLYRKSLLDKTGTIFPEGLIWEDGPFFFSIFFKTQRVSLVRDLLYYYRINRQGSIIQNGGIKFLDIIDVVNLMLKSLSQTPVFDDIKYEFYRRKADDIIYRYELINLKLIHFYWRKFVIRFMYKVMQVLYTEENIYYFKFWDLKFRLKKRANLYDVWYENDRIYVVLFMKIKFSFKFEYSKLEKK